MKKLSIIALILSLCVICIGCSAQSENEKDTGGKTSVSDSETLPTAKEGGNAEVFSIEEDENAKTTSSGDNQTTTEKDGKNGKDGKSDKDSKYGKSDDEESTTSQSREMPIIPIP